MLPAARIQTKLVGFQIFLLSYVILLNEETASLTTEMICSPAASHITLSFGFNHKKVLGFKWKSILVSAIKIKMMPSLCVSRSVMSSPSCRLHTSPLAWFN